VLELFSCQKQVLTVQSILQLPLHFAPKPPCMQFSLLIVGHGNQQVPCASPSPPHLSLVKVDVYTDSPPAQSTLLPQIIGRV